jgi:hypothetical protein
MKKFFILIFCLFVYLANFQIDAKAQENYNVIKEGRGMSGITVGRSTMDDVIKKFGKEYRWVVNKKYSYQMTYRNGLSFYICQSDKKKQVFVIEIRQPYKAKTSKGIILGKSTLADVHKAYGKLKSGTEYRGISFYYKEIGKKNIITSMDVTENSGIRQCKVGK